LKIAGERLEPGEYPAYCRAAKVYRDSQFKRWVSAVQFDVYDESLMNVLARLIWYLNLGSKDKPHASRRAKYWTAWVKANGGPPKRRDRISHTVFVGRQALVKVEDTGKNHNQVAVSAGEHYSVIRDVIEWKTGGPSR
jgi:hypothetical protein